VQGMSKCAHSSALTSEVPLRWDLLLLLSPYAAEKDRKDRREKTLVPLSHPAPHSADLGARTRRAILPRKIAQEPR